MDLTPYTGCHARLDDPRKQAVLLENSTFSRNVYRAGSVDWRFFDDAVVLTEATAPALYSESRPDDGGYVRGTRPFLERIAEQVLRGREGERARAIALMDWVCALPDLHPRPDPTADLFHGGTEEEVIRKGSSMCNEQARVLVVLAQIAGIPARYIGHMTPYDFNNPASGSGHGVAELRVEGAWAYFDVRGKFFAKPDGRLASTWDMVSHPQWVDAQPPEVLAHLRRGYGMESSKRYFSPSTLHIVCDYKVGEHGDYDYSWTFPSSSLWLEARERARLLRVTKHRDLLPQPHPRGEIQTRMPPRKMPFSQDQRGLRPQPNRTAD